MKERAKSECERDDFMIKFIEITNKNIVDVINLTVHDNQKNTLRKMLSVLQKHMLHVMKETWLYRMLSMMRIYLLDL